MYFEAVAWRTLLFASLLCPRALPSSSLLTEEPSRGEVRSLQHLHSVSVGPAAVEGNGSAEFREELWLMKAGPASPGRWLWCSLSCTAHLLHSLHLCVSRDCPISTGSSAGSCLGEHGFLKCVTNFPEGNFTYLILHSLAGT